MRHLILSVLYAATVISAGAAPLRNVPQVLIQPNGDTLRCFASGDEFFHYLHDADGYTIVVDTASGYYMYAVREGDGIKASAWRAGKINPAQAGLTKHILPSASRMRDIITARQAYYRTGVAPRLSDASKAPPAYVRNHGTLNNLVVFIRFSDEAEGVFSQPVSYFDNLCNGEASLKAYYEEVSYGKLTIPSTFYPVPSGSAVLSYQDAHPRSYYKPYSGANPEGYQNESQQSAREQALVANAANAVAGEVPSDLSIDMNADGYVDMMAFIVSGNSDGWNDLLWPHRWALYMYPAFIGDKRVYDFQFVPVGSLALGTLCHETFHVLGAPDLYHYYENYLSPVYKWDIMEVDDTPPQHMGAYMKYKYGNWIDEIPVIAPGRYDLAPLNVADSGNAFKIPVPGHGEQFYVVEYRKKAAAGFESLLPGSGMIVYRIDSRFEGNADYDGTAIFDEVYAFRPGGTQTANGNPARAHFSSASGRIKFNLAADPRPWINNAVNDDYTSITEISDAGETISFVYGEYGKVAWIAITMPDTIVAGNPVPLSATALPADAANRVLTWEIIDGSGIARIDGARLVGDTVGTVTVQASAQDGGGAQPAVKTVFVRWQHVDSIAITSAGALAIGASMPLRATVFPSNATVKTVVWSVIAGSGAAHIDGAVLTGDAPGAVTVHATAGDGSGVVAVKVVEILPIWVSSIDIVTKSTVYVGESIPLTAIVYPDDASNKAVRWSVINNTGAAHVAGLTLVGDAPGKVVLRASAEDGSGVQANRDIEIRPHDQKHSVNVSWTNGFGADGFLTVEAEKGLYRVELYAVSGAKIKEYPATGHTMQLSFAGLPKGVYIVHVWHDKTSRSAVKVMW